MGVIRNHRRQLLTARARDLRHDDTDAEARLWNALRARRLGGWSWKRQVAFGPYILDFLCREAALVVELDGGHHADQEAYDARRTAYLQRQGLHVLRFWNASVLQSRPDVCDAILHACGGEKNAPLGEEAPSTSSPPAKRRGRG